MEEAKSLISELENRRSSRPSIQSTEDALAQLGYPQNDYRVILVGGSNGKGSTVEMISEMLQSLDFDVGTFSSPHLESVTERIQINSEEISEEKFRGLKNEVKNTSAESFFEILTTMAYLHFSKEEVDYAVMEVGMGGRLDATNAADNNLAAVTTVCREHTEQLGETKEEISWEIAGIVPENGEVVNGSESDALEEVAQERDCEVLEPVEVENNGETLQARSRRFNLPVKGDFQRENLGVALRVVEVAERIPSDLEKSLEDLRCPGRMEEYSSKNVILEAAHNPAAAKRIKDDLPDSFVCVFGSTKNQHVKEMTRTLQNTGAQDFIFTQPSVEWSCSPENLNQEAVADGDTVREPELALEEALSISGERNVVVTGSMYLVGEVRGFLN